MGSGAGRTIKGDKWATRTSPGPGISRASSWERLRSLLGSLRMGAPPSGASVGQSHMLVVDILQQHVPTTACSQRAGGRSLLPSLVASPSLHLKADSSVFPLETASGEDALLLCDGEHDVHRQCRGGGCRWLGFPECSVVSPGLCRLEEGFSVWGLFGGDLRMGKQSQSLLRRAFRYWGGAGAPREARRWWQCCGGNYSSSSISFVLKRNTNQSNLCSSSAAGSSGVDK